MKTIEIEHNEHVIAVVPEVGLNQHYVDLVWVYIENRLNKQLRTESLYRDDWTPRMSVLFELGAQMHYELSRSISVKRNK